MRVERVPYRLITVAAAAVFLAACGKKESAPPPQTPEVGVVTVQPQAVPVFSELPGRTSAFLVAQVRARVDGIVLRREFTEGTDVKAGQRLYKIDPAPYVAALNSAKATLAKAQANLATQNALVSRYKVLVAANAVSKQDYDNAVATQGQAAADVAAGKAAVDTAQINLGYTDVVSPITGRVGISQVTPGAYVQASQATLMSTVQQLDPVYVDLTQSSLEGLKLRQDVQSGRLKTTGPGAAKVSLILEDGKTYAEPGKLQFSDVTVDQATGSVTIRAVFPNPGKVLLPGMFVRARIEEGVNENAFLVPQIGVTHDQKGQAIAMVVNASNKVEPRPLKTTGMQGQNWVVEGGLEAGDHVIVQGGEKVRPGATVKSVPAQLAPAANAASGAAATAAPAAAGSGAAAATGAAASGAAPASAAAASSAQ
ncbi:efflux transporter periplasmic adaptor subunit [Burkholderia stabilis]|uniref:Multidrug resistance protein mexA,multidrug efflux system transporter AcrA,efflux transporter, RND family, MFP subunit,HlyD family secretion protein n=1 Tax=Burkholderia stabilis TaxID=95485 RepID=A0AAJ5NDF9_9BURK|nr:efflux RND transporter periplasmic adaptor subunit [Burkholderia stabilis]AOR68861.1 efflux transporter periplasmic adaptor subunit [Burkholderia stabilis]VBB12874.1 Multidrug resistance protein mexA precursor,multidrug efflux system transporter AcrA,efflux transporter, RND family, MFP subunit,HlyD family secretion protein [Burkholderia stabilis]HDR9496136.1 efflux RND transporter periplasmic adaptor subunit [Burkholderia stabilis]HDR9527609.1 efflux RND transporter periplasmic adaptor subun